MIHRAHRASALAFVAALALTVFASTGSAANVRPDPFKSNGFSSGDSAVRSHAPKSDVYRHAPSVDVRSRPGQDVRVHTGRASYSSPGLRPAAFGRRTDAGRVRRSARLASQVSGG